MPRVFAAVANDTAAFITLIAVTGLVLAFTSPPTHIGAFAIPTGFGVLTLAAGIAAIRTGQRTWGDLLASGMVATTTMAVYAAAG